MEQSVKQRVVGAVVLVALAVIFIPVFLESPDETGVPQDLELPQEMEDLREGRIEPLEPLELPPETVTTVVIEEPSAEEGSATESSTSPESQTTPAEDTQEQVQADTEAVPVPVPTPGSAPEPEVPTAATPVDESVVKSGWVVQVGAFGSQDNAFALRDKLRKAGFTTFVEKVQVSGNTLYRVRVGPEIERTDADALLQKLTRETGVKGKVMSHP